MDANKVKFSTWLRLLLSCLFFGKKRKFSFHDKEAKGEKDKLRSKTKSPDDAVEAHHDDGS